MQVYEDKLQWQDFVITMMSVSTHKKVSVTQG